MAGPLELTFDAAIQSPVEPGFFHRYDSVSIIRNLNAGQDGSSPQAFWWDKESWTLMLKPEQLDRSFINSAGQLPYVIRFSQFTANPSNSLRVFEASFAQNINNPWIHHTPITPLIPSLWVDSPEQLPGLGNIASQANDPGSVLSSPHAPDGFPGVSTSDAKVICWTNDPLPWNMPLYLRWWMSPGAAGHLQFYDFCIGQFCVRCAPQVVEIFKDVSAHHDRSLWKSQARLPLFTGGFPHSTGFFSTAINDAVTEWLGHPRALLWLPYRRNYVYLESSYGQHAVFKANPFTVGNGLLGSQKDWGIVESRNLLVAGLTPGPGLFQIQKVKFPDGNAQFNLEPFVTDYLSTQAPANNWLVDFGDAYQGATLTHTTPATPSPYTFTVNDIDHCADAIFDPTTDQTRTYGSVYTLAAGADPTNPSLKTYTPMLYSVEARVPFTSINWPKAAVSINDRSAASPAAWIKKAEITASLREPTRFTAEVEDMGEHLAAYYFRSEFPLEFSDANGHEGDPTMWIPLWLGIAEPVQTKELRLDSRAPRELRLNGTDFFKWLNESPMRNQREWSGFGHIYVLQNILQQAGISIANWDGPAAGTVVQKANSVGQIVDTFVPDAMGLDDPLSGPLNEDPTIAMGTADSATSQPVISPWRAAIQPPDSYGSFIRRIAEVWSGWDYGFQPDGSFYYHKWDYHTASEVTFDKDQTGGDPHYFHASVEYEPLYPDANSVELMAATFGGSIIISTKYEDFASLDNPAAVNFIGKEKALFAGVKGVLSCDSLNKCARAVFERARRRRLHVHFHATYVPTLKLGHCFTLSGISGVWRLQAVRATYDRPNWNHAFYTGELVEAGHN